MKFVFALALVAICVMLMNARPNSKRATDEVRLHKRDGGAREHSSTPVDEDEAPEDKGEEKEADHPVQNGGRKKRSGIRSDTKLWAGGNVPYKFDPPTYGGEKLKNMVKDAVEEWNRKAGVNIHYDPSAEGDYIEINGKDEGCWSYIGYQTPTGGKNMNRVNLQENSCFHSGVILHEFGHALGLSHEAQREDAANYIKIVKENVESGFEGQFKPDVDVLPIAFKSSELHPAKYDFCSIMQYSPKAFSKNGKDTIKLLDSENDILPCLGSQLGLSVEDGEGMAKKYGNLDEASSKCKNAGYQLKGISECRCSNLFTGDKCETPKSSQQCEESNIVHELKVDEPKAVKTPEYDQNYPKNVECIWAFSSPEDTRLCIAFPDGFEIENPSKPKPPATTGVCAFDWMEVVLQPELTMKTKRYCGDGKSHTSEMISYENWAAIVFHSDDQFTEKGFEAVVVAVKVGETIEAMKAECKTIVTEWKKKNKVQGGDGGDGGYGGYEGYEGYGDYSY